ncbi:hypothetical protein DY000_02038293 [Brassica cretica]|uniref:Uncharacterized protein n=1 Tax=Brassica cretica TaxID=69181 RepID=A0ABQ7BBB9_BRACR|nr:hypothetical protein DY000_02038293 [Brassica cretica]
MAAPLAPPPVRSVVDFLLLCSSLFNFLFDEDMVVEELGSLRLVMALAGFNCTCFDPDLDPILHGLQLISLGILSLSFWKNHGSTNGLLVSKLVMLLSYGATVNGFLSCCRYLSVYGRMKCVAAAVSGRGGDPRVVRVIKSGFVGVERVLSMWCR